jgi:hypothetical protein
MPGAIRPEARRNRPPSRRKVTGFTQSKGESVTLRRTFTPTLRAFVRFGTVRVCA